MKFVMYMRVNNAKKIKHNSSRLKNGQLFDNLMKLSPLAKKLGLKTYRNPKSSSLRALNKRGGVL